MTDHDGLDEVITMRGMRTDLPASTPVSVALRSSRPAQAVLLTCLLLEVAFVLLDYHVNYGRLTDVGAVRRLTNITREDGLASWFATTQTLLVGLTAWVILLLIRAQKVPTWRQAGWLIVAMAFTFMSVDDGAQIHERLGTMYTVLRERRGADALGVYPSYAWQILFLPLFGILGLILVSFLWRELRRVRDHLSLCFVVTAFLLFGLAVGLDFLEGLDEKHPWNIYAWFADRYAFGDFTIARFGQSSYATLQHFSRSLEEFLEMLANTLLWTAFIRYLPSVADEVRIRLTV